MDRTEEKTQLRAEGCHNKIVMACDTYLKPVPPRTPRHPLHCGLHPAARRGPKTKNPRLYRGRSKSHAGREIFRSPPCANKGKSIKKDPLALRAARGSRTIFGSGLLSHMTLCSIIGDGELNFRVRNGVGCTLSSMATKEIW